MSDRERLIESFLSKNQIKDYTFKKIAGDASFRGYYRVFLKDKNLIVMDAPPNLEDIKPFYNIDVFLRDNGFLTPEIIAIDYDNGFILLEDFGDDSYTRILNKNPEKEEQLYKVAINTLLDLHKVKPPQDLAPYNRQLLMKEVMLFIDWYLPHVAKKHATVDQINKFHTLWIDLFDKMTKPSKLVLRDYHADNLMVLKNNNCGLLDFQDAVIGSAAYDLVSLLEDARRDVGIETQDKMLQYYLDSSDCDKESFLYDYKLLSLQRNIKIVGIFSRLAIRDKKEQYLNLLPRVLKHIKIRLEDPFLKEMKEFLSIFE